MLFWRYYPVTLCLYLLNGPKALGGLRSKLTIAQGHGLFFATNIARGHGFNKVLKRHWDLALTHLNRRVSKHGANFIRGPLAESLVVLGHEGVELVLGLPRIYLFFACPQDVAKNAVSPAVCQLAVFNKAADVSVPKERNRLRRPFLFRGFLSGPSFYSLPYCVSKRHAVLSTTRLNVTESKVFSFLYELLVNKGILAWNVAHRGADLLAEHLVRVHSACGQRSPPDEVFQRSVTIRAVYEAVPHIRYISVFELISVLAGFVHKLLRVFDLYLRPKDLWKAHGVRIGREHGNTAPRVNHVFMPNERDLAEPVKGRRGLCDAKRRDR